MECIELDKRGIRSKGMGWVGELSNLSRVVKVQLTEGWTFEQDWNHVSELAAWHLGELMSSKIIVQNS